MSCISRLVAVGILLAAAPAFAADAKYTIQAVDTPPPKELAEPIRKLLSDRAVQLRDEKGTVLCDLWLRKQLPVKAAPAQVKSGLSYRDLDESTLLGAVRFDQEFTDYRKHKVKPGVYTLRLGFQPMDGDHMGTAPYGEFCLILSAKEDLKADLMDTKRLQEMSAKAMGGSHPGVFLLFPNENPLPMPQLVEKENNHWVVMLKEPLVIKGQKEPAGLGIGLTLIGHTAAE
jgi:hypothetical protein